VTIIRFPTTYTVEQTATVLRCSTFKVLQLIRVGRLRALKFGKRYQIPDEEIKSCLDQELDRCARRNQSSGSDLDHRADSPFFYIFCRQLDESLLDQLAPRISRKPS
jgi:excisionase family DNA binding protein